MRSPSSKKIALVTPWPPQKSGIADYARDLHRAFCGLGHEIDVFTNAEEVSDDIIVRPIRDVEKTILELSEYSSVLLQLGNHPFFHAYMLPIVAALGPKCTVELHDFLLAHILPGLNYQGDPEFERRWLQSNYAPAVSEISEMAPISDVVCKRARQTIVHSAYAASRLRKLGVKDVHVVHLSYDPSSLRTADDGKSGSENDLVEIGVLGTLQPNRRIDQTIVALDALHRAGFENWRLNLVGRRCEGFDELRLLVEKFGLNHKVRFFNDLEGPDFLLKIASMDIHVALRKPTMGETSGVVVQGMIAGVPTIVSNGGWYSELPDLVAKIEDSSEIYALCNALANWIKNPSLRKEIGLATGAFARQEFNVRRRAAEILNLVSES